MNLNNLHPPAEAGGNLRNSLLKFLLQINSQICLGNFLIWKPDRSVGFVVKNDFSIFYPGYPSYKHLLALDRVSDLYLCPLSDKFLKIANAVQFSLQPGRRNFQQIRRRNKIVGIENCFDTF